MDIPDTMKAQLIDDWENVTKNQQVKKRERKRESGGGEYPTMYYKSNNFINSLLNYHELQQ